MADRFPFQGCHALVTGASRGIGEALARDLAGRGARVTVVARSAPALEVLAKEIGGEPRPADLNDVEGLHQVVCDAEAVAGPIDVLVNNAAVGFAGPFVDRRPEHVRQCFDVNVVAPIELSRLVLPGMLERRRGRIVNISSMAGMICLPSFSIYGASKAALAQFSGVLHRELRNTPVRVTLVHLGGVQGTEIWEESLAVPGVSAIRDRFARVGGIPALTPEQAALRILEGAAAGRNVVAAPRWLAPVSGVIALPSRLNDLLLPRST